MSNEMSRRELLDGGLKSFLVLVVLTILKFLGLASLLQTSACADVYEIEADGISTILQLTNNHLNRGNHWKVYRGRVNGSFAEQLNGYNPSTDNPSAGWIFEVDGREVNGRNIDPFSYVPRRRQTITWQVVEST